MDEEWIEVEMLGGQEARPRDWGRYLRENHPELRAFRDEDFRIDVVCGRDGVDRVRLFRRPEPTERPSRKKPRR